MSPKPSLAVALLAGGKSSRMGRDKSALPGRDGLPLWRNRLNLLREFSTGEVFISCRGEQSHLHAGEATTVFDHLPGTGPLGGIAACLEVMESDRLLVLAVDLPAVDREILASLVDLAEAGPGGAVFRSGRFLEPLAAVYPKAMAAMARQRLHAGQWKLSDWIREAGPLMREVELPSAWEPRLLNLNDPAAWQAWLEGGPGKD